MKQHIYALAGAHLFVDTNAGALPAILPFFVTAYGMNYKDVAGLMFALSFLSSIIQPAFGYFADKVPKQWFMPAGLLICGVPIGAVGFFENYWLIFAAVTISGIGSAVFHPEAARMVNKVAGERKGTALSIFSVGGNGGFSLGPLIAVAVIVPFGLKGTAIFGALAVIIAVALFFIVPRMEASLATHASQESKTTGNQAAAAGSGHNNWNAFSRLTFIIFCRSIIFCALNSFLPLFWVSVLMQTNAVGATALTIFFALGIVTTLIGGILADRFGCIAIIKYSSIALVPALFLLSLTGNVMLASVVLVPIGFALFAPFSSVVVLGQSYLARSIGFASGVTLGLSFSVGGIVAPLLGWLADQHGLVFIIQLLSAMAIIAVVASFLLPQPEKQCT